MGFHLPFFPLYAAETLADGRFQGWNLEERGAWITLLCLNWNDGSIPASQTELARHLHAESHDMARIWSAIGDRFCPVPGEQGRMWSPRLEEERDKAMKLSRVRSGAGKKGAKARWDKENKPDGKRMRLPKQTHGKANAVAMRSQCPRQSQSQLPSPSPSPSSDSQSVSLAGGLEDFRSKLEKRLGVPRLSVGRDADTVAACFAAQLDAVGEDALLEECCDLARKSTNGTPSSLAWFVGWLQRLPLPEAHA